MPKDNPEHIKRLVAEVQQGNRKAFAELYDLYSPSLYGVVSKIVRSDEAGQDVLQEAFVKVWKNIKKYDPKKGSIFTWMLNIARNTAIDRLRKLQKENKVEIQTLETNVHISKDHHDSISTSVIGLKDWVEKLKPEHRLMVEYIYFNGYTQQEVADELNMPLGTVKTRARSAIQQLRKVFTALLFWI
ncbi:MAG: RNA polymerase sigma factor [Flavobacteriales bacterium]|nr:RNA polymerase sigma factor [Flavobacteriales bacterium]